MDVKITEEGTTQQRPSVDHLPFARKYQLEAVEMAIKQNTIVFLETGSGKTLIAVMLLRSYASLLRKPSPFFAVFLVPTVPLVQQQSEALMMCTDLKVGKYWRGKGTDYRNPASWSKEVDQHEVLVMTPGILLAALRHSCLKIDMIKVLIFDECHNARGKHPYACIMTEFYHQEMNSKSSNLPRILGMTASPIKAKDCSSESDYWQRIHEFENLMHSKIYTCPSESVLAEYIPSSTTKLKFYEYRDIPHGVFKALANELKPLRNKDGDDVQPPLPVTRDVLYDNAISFGVPRVGCSSHEDHSVVPIRNFEEEISRSSVWETGNVSSSTVDGSRDNLASLYRPPFGLMFHGPFEKAKDSARTQNKWLLVNLQSTREFSSHMLNRDTWADEVVAQTIKTNFIFWQVYNDTEEGNKVYTYYKLDSIPVIMVIDPVTGQKMRSWRGMVQPETLLEDLVPFMDGSPTDHPINLSHKHPSESSQSPPRRSQVSSGLGQNEEDKELQWALAASMEGEKDIDFIDSSGSGQNEEDEELQWALAASMEGVKDIDFIDSSGSGQNEEDKELQWALAASMEGLKYHETGEEKDCLPQVGQWNMMNKKMINGITVCRWACINFSRSVHESVARGFCDELAKMCQVSGMEFNPEPVIPIYSARPNRVEKALKHVYRACMNKLKGKELELLLAILPDNNGSLYGDLKRICETELGLISQCCLTKHVFKINKQYLANVSLKINVKMGDKNTVLLEQM